MGELSPTHLTETCHIGKIHRAAPDTQQPSGQRGLDTFQMILHASVSLGFHGTTANGWQANILMSIYFQFACLSPFLNSNFCPCRCQKEDWNQPRPSLRLCSQLSSPSLCWDTLYVMPLGCIVEPQEVFRARCRRQDVACWSKFTLLVLICSLTVVF